MADKEQTPPRGPSPPKPRNKAAAAARREARVRRLWQRLVLIALCVVAVGIVDLRARVYRQEQGLTENDGYFVRDDVGAGEDVPVQSTPEPVERVAYTGIVENIVIRPLIAYPELAFDGDDQEASMDAWHLTVSEYKKLLESLYNNGYVLVYAPDLYEETTDAYGRAVMTPRELYVPKGKTPLILNFDDFYTTSMRENGTVYKLILDENGEFASWGLDPQGQEVVSYELDAITILEAFIAEHPDFSLDGARATLGLSGKEGILGYATQSASPTRTAEIQAVEPVIHALLYNGYTFAYHSYAHFDFSQQTAEAVQQDVDQWLSEVGSLVGETTLVSYPYGGRLDNSGQAMSYLLGKGFRVFQSMGIESYVNLTEGLPIVNMDRLHPDGQTLRWNRDIYLDFFDAKEIFDYDVRPDLGYDFE